MLMPLKEQKKFDKLCGIWNGFDKGKHRLVTLDITASHYNVVDVFVDKHIGELHHPGLIL